MSLSVMRFSLQFASLVWKDKVLEGKKVGDPILVCVAWHLSMRDKLVHIDIRDLTGICRQ